MPGRGPEQRVALSLITCPPPHWPGPGNTELSASLSRLLALIASGPGQTRSERRRNASIIPSPARGRPLPSNSMNFQNSLSIFEWRPTNTNEWNFKATINHLEFHLKPTISSSERCSKNSVDFIRCVCWSEGCSGRSCDAIFGHRATVGDQVLRL